MKKVAIVLLAGFCFTGIGQVVNAEESESKLSKAYHRAGEAYVGYLAAGMRRTPVDNAKTLGKAAIGGAAGGALSGTAQGVVLGAAGGVVKKGVDMTMDDVKWGVEATRKR